jgi:hypothetical protein
MARAKTANPVLDSVLDVPPAAACVRLSVRTAPAHGGQPRYRAGLGPFGPEPLTVEATPEQAESLRADPMLIVE